MEVRPISEAFLKSRVHPAPLMFLYPVLCLRPIQQPHQRSQPQYFSTTPHSPAKSKAAPSNRDIKSEPSILSTASNSRISQLLKDSTPPPGRKTSADLLEESYASRIRDIRPVQGAIYTQTIDAKENTAREREKPEVNSPTIRPPTTKPVDFANLFKTPSPPKIDSNPLAHYNQHSYPLEPASPTVRTIRSSPMIGRSFSVRRGDVGTALKFLNHLCVREGVVRDLRTQKFYERPGAKKKRLRSVRHKTRFKYAFKTTVERIKEMRRKGW